MTAQKWFVAFSVSLCLGLFAMTAHGAESKAPPMKPLATCNDGKTEYSTTNEHRGACSGHGGVKAWADGSPVKSHAKRTEYK